MNVALAGGNWQCDWDDGTCDEMDKEINWAEKEPGEKSNEFKYVFDVSFITLPECISGLFQRYKG